MHLDDIELNWADFISIPPLSLQRDKGNQIVQWAQFAEDNPIQFTHCV